MRRLIGTIGILSFFTLVIAGALFLAGRLGSARYTRTDYLADIEPVIDSWGDTLAIAKSSARIALPPQIARLQEIHRQTESLSIPAIAHPVHWELLDYMDCTIRAFIAFMAQKEDAEIERLFKQAGGHFDAWTIKAQEIGE